MNAPAWKFAIVFVITALIATLTIRESLTIGRLTRPPTHGDVGFTIDAARRMDAVFSPTSGSVVISLARNYLERPPDSLYTTPIAMLSFAMFGMNDWAPYVLHSVGLFVLLMLVVKASDESSPWISALYALPVALLPLGPLMIHEFHSDYMCAMLIAWGVWRAANTPMALWSKGRAVGIGLCFGGAALAKPHAFPAALGFLGLTVAHSFLAQVGATRVDEMPGSAVADDRTSLVRALLRTLKSHAWIAMIPALACGLFILPHAILDGRNIVDYIRVTMYGANASAWKLQANGDDSLAWALSFYLTGDGGRLYFGHAIFVLIALTAFGLVLVWTRGHRSDRRELTICATACAAGYVIAATAPLKHVVFGLPFYMLLVLCATIGMRTLVGSRSLIRWPWVSQRVPRWIPLLPITLGCLAGFDFPKRWGGTLTAPTPAIWRAYEELSAIVLKELGTKGGQVVVAFAGAVDATNLEWNAIKSGLTNVQFHALTFQRTLEECERYVSRANLVITTVPNSAWIVPYFPATALLEPLRSRLDNDRDFQLVKTVEGPRPNAEYRVYRRVDRGVKK